MSDPTYEELREMLPGCMDCPVPTTDPNNLHAQMREVCVGCFLDGPHKRMTGEEIAGGDAAQLVIELRQALQKQVSINSDLVSRNRERTASLNRAEELLASCRDLSEQRRVRLDKLEGENLGLGVACRELNGDASELHSLLRDAEAGLTNAFGDDQPTWMHSWLERVRKVNERRL